MIEGLADRFRRHRLQPQTADGLFDPAKFDQIPKNQFPFPSGVAGVDQKIDIGALHQALKHVEARFRFLDRPELKFVRDNREIGKAPFPTLHIELARQGQFNQMSKRGRDDVAVAFEMIAFLLDAEGLCEIARYARLLRDNQGFRHW